MRLGQRMTEEQRARDSAAHKTPQFVAIALAALVKAREKNIGCHPTPESLAKQSAAMMGHVLTVETRAAISKTLRGRFVGEAGPGWKGGITPEMQRIRNSNDYAVWHIMVFVRDDYACQKCHKRGGDLEVHHMDCFADFPDKRLDPDNGIVFCLDCHRELHHRYGVLHNRRWQTDEFLSEGQNGD